MNTVILIGRLTKDPEIKRVGTDNIVTIANYSLAVDRRFHKDGEQSADFFNCVCFGKAAEFAEKYLHKGMKIAINGRLQTNSYTNKEGHRVNTVEVLVENHEFCESKAHSSQANQQTQQSYQAPQQQVPPQFTPPPQPQYQQYQPQYQQPVTPVTPQPMPQQAAQAPYQTGGYANPVQVAPDWINSMENPFD